NLDDLVSKRIALREVNDGYAALKDGSLDQAIPAGLLLAFLTIGDTCAAGTRLLVPRSRLNDIKRRIREAMRAFTVGDPADAKTAIGPMVSQDRKSTRLNSS